MPEAVEAGNGGDPLRFGLPAVAADDVQPCQGADRAATISKPPGSPAYPPQAARFFRRPNSRPGTAEFSLSAAALDLLRQAGLGETRSGFLAAAARKRLSESI
jgi:hypothetical protein